MPRPTKAQASRREKAKAAIKKRWSQQATPDTSSPAAADHTPACQASAPAAQQQHVGAPMPSASSSERPEQLDQQQQQQVASFLTLVPPWFPGARIPPVAEDPLAFPPLWTSVDHSSPPPQHPSQPSPPPQPRQKKQRLLGTYLPTETAAPLATASRTHPTSSMLRDTATASNREIEGSVLNLPGSSSRGSAAAASAASALTSCFASRLAGDQP